MGRERDVGTLAGHRTMVRHVARGWGLGWDGAAAERAASRSTMHVLRRRVGECCSAGAGHAKHILDGNAICRSKNVTMGAAAPS